MSAVTGFRPSLKITDVERKEIRQEIRALEREKEKVERLAQRIINKILAKHDRRVPIQFVIGFWHRIYVWKEDDLLEIIEVGKNLQSRYIELQRILDKH